MTVMGVHDASLSGTHTGSSMVGGGRGGPSGVPGRGAGSGGNVVEGQWDKPALPPAPPATALGALALVSPQQEPGLKVRLHLQLCSLLPMFSSFARRRPQLLWVPNLIKLI